MRPEALAFIYKSIRDACYFGIGCYGMFKLTCWLLAQSNGVTQ